MLRTNIWRFPFCDPYRLLRPFLFQMDPEKAHTLALKLLANGLGPKVKNDTDPILHTSVCGLDFANPIGIAAGFDKNAEAIKETLNTGAGYSEIGTITPLRQDGNPRPRLFRAEKEEAVINRLGFNSHGMETCLRRIKAWHDETRVPAHNSYQKQERRGLLGINIGMNRDSEDAIGDYVKGYRLVAPYADYVAINISSPNTPGLRDLQLRDQLQPLLRQLAAAREADASKPPIFVKLAPDLTDAQQEDIAAILLASGVQGLILGNTSLWRGDALPENFARETGGLSGRPLFSLSTHVLGRMYRLLQGKLPLMGCGGVFSGADAYAKIRAGASLVQIYSALVFEGPGLVARINRDLAELLRRDGFKSVAEAVGTTGAKPNRKAG
ncbi:MAG: quinone-dependent dihydroorotate dehydrogenase [Bdellovibrionales bacterium]